MDAGKRQGRDAPASPVEPACVNGQPEIQHLPGHARWLQDVEGAGIDCQGLGLVGGLVAHLDDPWGLPQPCQEQCRPQPDWPCPNDQRLV